MGARLDQHFLIDEAVRDRIALAVQARAGERIVEIGPGRGFLTQALLKAGAEVLAVELDWGLAARLSREHAEEPRFKLIAADFLKLGPEEFGGAPVKFAANLPYAVATPILQRILLWDNWTWAVLMFQKEVAERIAARSGADYGLLSLSVFLRAEAEVVAEAGRGSFSPRPKVESAVVRFKRREAPLADPRTEEAVMRIARAAFGQRRKMAAGLVAHALGLPREKAAAAFKSFGLPATVRAEAIPPEIYLKLPAALRAAAASSI